MKRSTAQAPCDHDIISDSQSSEDNLELRMRRVTQPGSTMLTTDDTDKQFWADNEFDTASLSDTIINNKMTQLPGPSQRTHLTQNQHSRKTRDTRLQNSPADQSTSNEPTMEVLSTHLNNLCLNVPPGSCVRSRRPLQARNRVAKRARLAQLDSEGVSSSSESDTPSGRRPLPASPLLLLALPGERCPRCHVRPKDAVVVHGGIGHQCYCYPCTMKLRRSNARCGMCHRHIRTVVKNVRAAVVDTGRT